MACQIRNYSHLDNDESAAALRADPMNTTVTIPGHYDALRVTSWLKTDEAIGWAYFGFDHHVTFSDAPTAVAFKLRFG